MSIYSRDAGAVSRLAGAVYFRTADGTDPANLATVGRMRLRTVAGSDPVNLSEFYKQGIRLAASPAAANGQSSAKSTPIITNSVTVGVAGGTPPYTHSWVATAEITVDSPSSATTSFRATPPPFSGQVDGSALDTVTDANGLTNSIEIPILITRG